MSPAFAQPASRATLRQLRRLARRRHRANEGLFVAEGPQAVAEALHRGDVVHVVANPDSGWAGPSMKLAHDVGVPLWSADEDALSGVTDTHSSQGILAVCRLLPAGRLPKDPSLVVLGWEIKDPGNAGTLIRTADAFGADAVAFTSGSVDVHNAKVGRASAGSIFHLPLITDADGPSLLRTLRKRGMQRWAADAGGVPVTGVDATQPTAWVFGNEARGLDAEAREECDAVVSVPMWGNAESLNVASAAAVCLFTSASHQRHAWGETP